MKENYVRPCKSISQCLVLTGCLLLPSTLTLAGLVPNFSDNFNDNSTDTTLWSAITIGTGPTIGEVNGQLVVSFPANSQIGAGYGYTAIAGTYRTKNFYAGDFDARVDFHLLNWPDSSGVRMALSVGPWRNVERDSPIFPGDGRDAYVMSLSSGLVIRDTTDLNGTLRLVRKGDVYFGYFWDSSLGAWNNLGSSVFPSGDNQFSLSVYTDASLFAHKDVSVAFDNFIVTSVPEPSTYIAGLGAVGMLALFSWRNRR